MSNLIIIAGFFASVAAAIYAGLTYHYPRRPPERKIPSYLGELPKDAESLFDFLVSNLHKIVHLRVQIGLTRGAAPPDQLIWVKRYERSDEIPSSDVLEIEHEKEGSHFKAEFTIIACTPKVEYINAWTIDLTLEGNFIPKIDVVVDAARASGSLIQVDPIQLASYIAS